MRAFTVTINGSWSYEEFNIMGTPNVRIPLSLHVFSTEKEAEDHCKLFNKENYKIVEVEIKEITNK
jgi:hypothetical protein